jgi:TPR repeat protein
MDKHLIQAAERGDAVAQFNLAIVYANGLLDSRYVPEGSRPEAVKWLLAAAEQGLARAQVKLAELYAGEPAVPGNSIKACGWFLLATAGLRGANLQSAQAAYQRASLRLTPAQIEKAKRFAQGWKPAQPRRAAISEPANSDGGRA